MNTLPYRVKDSVANNTEVERAEMKRVDSSVQPAFNQPSRKTQREGLKKKRKQKQAVSFSLKPREAIVPRPHEEWPHVWRGPHEKAGYIPEHLKGLVFTGDKRASDIGVIEDHHRPYIKRGSEVADKRIGHIEPRLASSIISGAEARKRILAAAQAET